eukprot:PITA_36059
MVALGIIEPVKEFDWVSPIVVQEKKKKEEIRICVDVRKLNDACVHDPFPNPFTDEVLDNVGDQEAYSFTDGFSGYHQIKIVSDDRMFGLVKFHVVSLRLMLDAWWRYQIMLNLKKCLFCVHFEIFLGHVVCRQGQMVDPVKIAVIINL